MKLNNFFLVIGMSFLLGAQNGEWELQKEGKGIKVYTRELSYSPIKEFRASCIIHTSNKNLISTLNEIENYPSWVSSVSYAKSINIKSGIGMYYQLDLPWPIKDRDLAMSMYQIDSKNSTILTLESISNMVDANNDFIRMTQVVGTWKVTSIDDNSCIVTYQFLGDPAGDLPSWVINMFLIEGPFETLINLQSKFSE